MRRIGITTRSCDAQGYNERRDGIARDWYRLLGALDIGFQWLLLPNLGADTISYAQCHGVNALILTGGDDVGTYSARDVTEHVLLAYATQHQWPVLGVCRGMQFMHTFAGGQLVSLGEEHTACRHEVTISAPLPWASTVSCLEVNSFHRWGIKSPAAGLQSLAWHADTCEAFVHNTLPWVGIMWHPEREITLSPMDRALFCWLFEVE